MSPWRRVTEPTSHQARESTRKNTLTSFTPIARTVPGAVRECDAPVLPCSAFRLLSSLSHSRVGYWQWPKPPSCVDASARSRATPEEPPLSWGRVTQAPRRSPLRSCPREFSTTENQIVMIPLSIAALTNARKPNFSALIFSDVKAPTGHWQLGRLKTCSG